MGLLFRSFVRVQGPPSPMQEIVFFKQRLVYEIADVGQGNKLKVLVPDSQASHSIDKNHNETPQCFSICKLLQSSEGLIGRTSLDPHKQFPRHPDNIP